jgi:adenylate cyclase
MLVNVLRSLGQAEQAKTYALIGIQRAEDELKLHPENANVAGLGAIVLAFLGQKERAVEWLARALAPDPGDLNIQYNAACTYAVLGEAERALDLLERWVPQVSGDMLLWFRNDSDFDGIRDHPRWQRVIELARQP